MARAISARLRDAMLAQETGEVLLAICQISHPSILNGPIRVVNNLENLVSDGQTYTAFPFQITIPSDTAEGRPTLRLILDNVDRQMVQAIRNLSPTSTPTVQVDLVLASTPDVIEVSFPNLSLRNVSYDVFTVEGELALNEDDREPFPADTFSPQQFPGLY